MVLKKEEVKKIWKAFEDDLISLNEYLKDKTQICSFNISNFITGFKTKKNKPRDLNFKCSTINARNKIKRVLNINSRYDYPDDFNKYAEISYFNENYENMYLFHPYDTNHPNIIGHYIIGKNYIHIYTISYFRE